MTPPPDTPPPEGTALDRLVELSRRLGAPTAEFTILAEGNTSMRTGTDRMLVKATGAALSTAMPDDFVEVDLPQLDAVIADEHADDDAVSAVFARARTVGTRRPSVEALLHAVCYELTDCSVVAHTHPTAVNALLCSDRAEALVEGSLFPDQIVVLGTNPLLVPYTDPGLALARSVRDRLASHIDRTGLPPRVIYLANHGMFALGATAAQVEQITRMADKTARVLLGALSAGTPVYLDAEHERRIDTRPDEQLRREALGSDTSRNRTRHHGGR